MPACHNGLARWTYNPQVVGSTLTVGAYYYILGKVEFQYVDCFPWDCYNLSGRISYAWP